jgi:hypothetical protein
MPCLLLFGPTGMGKTRIVQKFLREHRSSFDDVTGRTRLPIVAVQMPPAPSERDLYGQIPTKVPNATWPFRLSPLIDGIFGLWATPKMAPI